MVFAPGDGCRVDCLVVWWGRAGIGCWAIAISVVGRAGNWVGLLSVCWADGLLFGGLWLVVAGTVKSCWVGSAKVCGDGLELVCLW